MSANRRRSRKRSVASSKQPPDHRTLYLDRNLGKHVIADALRDVGFQVEVHDDHLPIDAPDEDWIELVGKKGWIALTKDKNIRYRFAELDAIKTYKARVVVIRAKNVTGNELAELVVKHHGKIQRFSAAHKAPFVAGIDRAGKISVYPM